MTPITLRIARRILTDEQWLQSVHLERDWHHHRASVNVSTLNHSVENVGKLSRAFEHVYMIMGNHDLYYREKRDLNSLPYAGLFENVTLVEDAFVKDDVALIPWLVGDDHKKLGKISAKYMFGHLELPRFYMNAMVEMPDHGEINEDHMTGFEKVFSGHFHKRQARKNIWYIGNAFPHNYADAGDDARGMMILEWGSEPEFHTWPRQPVFRVHKLSDILENPEGLLLIDSYVRVHLDIEISYEEANFLRETWIPEHKLREMALIPMKADMNENGQTADGLKFESVDQIIIDQINSIESNNFDKKILLDIYNNL